MAKTQSLAFRLPRTRRPPLFFVKDSFPTKNNPGVIPSRHRRFRVKESPTFPPVFFSLETFKRNLFERTTNKKVAQGAQTRTYKNFVFQPGDLHLSPAVHGKHAQDVVLELQATTNSKLQGQAPQVLYKRLEESLKRKYHGSEVSEVLQARLKELFPTKDSKTILQKDLILQAPGKPTLRMPIFHLFKELFGERKADDKALLKILHYCEPWNYRHECISTRLKNLAQTLFSQGAFYEYRTALALDYLKATKVILGYKQIKKNSYLDKLGLDFLVKASIDGKEQIFAIQVKSSDIGEQDFYRPKTLLWYNMRNDLPRETKVQRQGIMLMRADGANLSSMADRIKHLICDSARRFALGIKTIDAKSLPPKSEPGVEEIKPWLSALEKNFISLDQAA